MKHMTKAALCAAIMAFALPQGAMADASHQPDDHAPIAVMGDHNHKKGEWMLSYRYSQMSMSGNQDGTTELTPAQVRAQGFGMAPIEMDMEMHMFGGMYGVSDTLTVMAMLPYIRKEMLMENGALARARTSNEGFGDVKVSGLYTLAEAQKGDINHKWLMKFGLSLPTGEVDGRGTTLMGPGNKLPYGMQLGSGTFDPMFAVTYTQSRPEWSFGAQANTVIRLGENSEDYRLGNRVGATTWVARNLNQNVSVSARLTGEVWGDISGEDSDLNPLMSPSMRADLRAGERLDASIGVNYMHQTGALAGHRLAAEFFVPVYENFDGPQLQRDYRLVLGWQKAF